MKERRNDLDQISFGFRADSKLKASGFSEEKAILCHWGRSVSVNGVNGRTKIAKMNFYNQNVAFAVIARPMQE